MTDNVPEGKIATDKMPEDPVINFFASLKFDDDVFGILAKATEDPEMYDKFFQIPELFVLGNAGHVMATCDPNREKGCIGEKDHLAFMNMLRWFATRCAADPVWMCYLGWFFRFTAAHTDPSSYWPIKFSPRFLPKNFIKRGELISIAEENAKVRSPEEVFGKRK